MNPETIRKAEALKAATLIDQGSLPDAKSILEQLYRDYEALTSSEEIDKERDNQVLVYSLLGIIKKDGQPKDKFDFK